MSCSLSFHHVICIFHSSSHILQCRCHTSVFIPRHRDINQLIAKSCFIFVSLYSNYPACIFPLTLFVSSKRIKYAGVIQTLSLASRFSHTPTRTYHPFPARIDHRLVSQTEIQMADQHVSLSARGEFLKERLQHQSSN